MEWRWKMERGTDWNGAGGWLMNRSSRMRVIIMTDVVYSHFPPRIIYSVEVKNPPTLSLSYRRVLRSHAKPCHNLSFSANTGSIYPALGLPLSALLHFYSASIRLLSFCLFLYFLFILCFCMCPSQLPLSFLLFSLLPCWHGCVWLLLLGRAHVRC